MVTEPDIRNQVIDVLRSRKSISELQFWLVDKAWDSESDSPLAAAELATDVEFFLAEYSSKVITRTELLERLLLLTRNASANLLLDGVPIRRKVVTSSSSRSLVAPQLLQA